MQTSSITIVGLSLSFVCLPLSAATQDSKVSFTNDVRPILSNACFHCHGPDEETREADLRLDLKEGLFTRRDDLTIVAPGDHSASELIRRILSDDPDEVMPPAEANKPLSAEQKRILVKWVNQGAPWEGHWAFLPPRAVDPKPVEDDQWSRTDIDRFINRRLSNAKLTPAAQAGPYTLVRRVYLDLTGVQPTPQEADNWVLKLTGQTGSNASRAIDEEEWQNLITHLLASPRYGERWARRWLDLARYADTNGYEKDRDRTMWPWRDWVVSSINSGMPFDQYTIQQIAGDMLPEATITQRLATGFHRNTMLNEEGGIDPLEFRFHAMTDRVATTGTTWLGLTLGCCQCHTHKYDPISHHEYYQIMALLNNADEPSLPLPDTKLDQLWDQNKRKADQLEANLVKHWPVESFQISTPEVLQATADGNQALTQAGDGFTVVSGPNPNSATYTIELSLADNNFDAIRLSTRPVQKNPGPGRTSHGNFVLSEISFEVSDASNHDLWQKLKVASATATDEQSNYPIGRAFDDNESTGWGIHANGRMPRTPSATFTFESSEIKTSHEGPLRLRVTLKQNLGSHHTIAAFKFDVLKTHSDELLNQLREQEIATAFRDWHATERQNAVQWNSMKPVRVTSNLPILTIESDDSIFASGDTAKRDDYYLEFAAVDFPITALRLEALPDPRLPAGGPGSTYYEGTLGDFYLTELTTEANSSHFPFRSASETFARNRYGNNPVSASLAFDGDVQTGWSVHGRQGERHVAVFNFERPIPPNAPVKIQMTFGRHFASSLGRFRFSATSASTVPVARKYNSDTASLIRKDEADLSKAERQQLRNVFLQSTPQLAKQAETIRKLRQRPVSTSAMILTERPVGHERKTYRHHRGEYLQPRDEVTPGIPDVLKSATTSPKMNRLDFARWLVSGQNALTARVVANRNWQAFFGEGLVRTLDDFGLQGEAPSHPELLDWLAVNLVQTDEWSIKKFHRRIVSSAVYRQAAIPTEVALTTDPDNRLLSHSPRFRLDAEIVRDQYLLAAGVLSQKIGGPPVKPLQPAGVSEVAYGNPKWTASSGEDRYRRSLYTYAKRTSPFAMFNAFDAPTGESCVAKRNRSNSPLQALTLLNDVMMMDLAQHAGRKYSNFGPDIDGGISALFRSILVRPPEAAEAVELRQFFETQQQRFLSSRKLTVEFLNNQDLDQLNDADLSAVAAWTATARAIFGLDESLTRE